MYLWIIYGILVGAIITFLCFDNDETFEDKFKVTLAGALFLFIAGLLFTMITSCALPERILSTEKYSIIPIDGNYAAITNKGISFVYKKDNVFVSGTTSSISETTEATPYLEIRHVTTESHWIFFCPETTQTEIFFPSELLKLSKGKAEKQ